MTAPKPLADYVTKKNGLIWVFRPEVIEAFKEKNPQNWGLYIKMLVDLVKPEEGQKDLPWQGMNLTVTRRGRKVTVKTSRKSKGLRE